MAYSFILISFVLINLTNFVYLAPQSQSSRLFRYLSDNLSNYSNVTLPSRHEYDEPIIVRIQVQVIQILEVVSPIFLTNLLT